MRDETSPLISGRLHGFGAWAPETSDGHLLLGRIFAGRRAGVDEDRMVIIVNPRGHPSSRWRGPHGGRVSAMNRAGLAVRSTARRRNCRDTGAPTSIVARDVVQTRVEHFFSGRRLKSSGDTGFCVGAISGGSRQDGASWWWRDAYANGRPNPPTRDSWSARTIT